MTSPQRRHLPPRRNLPQLRRLERRGEQRVEGGREARGPALGLRAHRVEVHEPRPEQRPRHLLERLAHAPVQLDLVVERAEHARDRALLFEGRDGDRQARYIWPGDGSNGGTARQRQESILPFGRPEVVEPVAGLGPLPVEPDSDQV